jgi:hypothetical protein
VAKPLHKEKLAKTEVNMTIALSEENRAVIFQDEVGDWTHRKLCPVCPVQFSVYQGHYY